MEKGVRAMEYKLLKAYAELFGADFPISSVKDTMNAYEVRRAIQECLDTGKAYSTGTTAAKAKAASKTA